MIVNHTAVLDVRQYAAQYELLRAQVSGTARVSAWGRAAEQARGIGLALLLREGMPGWLQAITLVLRAAPAAAPSVSGVQLSPCTVAEEVATPKTFAPAQHRDITMLLASLVFSTRHRAGLSPSEGG